MSTQNVIETTQVVGTDGDRYTPARAARGNGAGAPTTEQAQTPVRSMLFRHPTDKMIAGVCGGLADFLGWDPTLVRLAWVVLTLVTGGSGLLAYLALWTLLPVGTMQNGQLRPATIELSERTLVRAAYVLIGLGLVWLLANVGILPSLWSFFWGTVSVVFWPALLIGAGYLLLRGSNRNWRGDIASARNRVRMSFDGKMPSRDEMKAGLSETRQRIPLKRSREDRMLLGVCGGIGKRLGIDANLVRLIWAAFSVGSIGMGVLLYVLLGLLLPEENATDVMARQVEPQNVQVVDGTVTRV